MPVSRSRSVLIVVENLSVPFDRRVWQESLALRDAGYRVAVICPQGTDRDREPFAEIDGIEIHRYPLRAATGGPAGYPREYGVALGSSLRRALSLDRRFRFDVVHVCNPPDLLFLVGLPLKLRGARLLFDHHDLVPELFLSRFGGGGLLLRGVRLFERLTFRFADGVLSTNESYRRVALERGGVPADRVTVVRSAPDLKRFRRQPPEPALKRGKEHLLVYLGVMGPQDGVDYALRAVKHLKDDLGRTDFHAAFIGGGDSYDEMVRLSRSLGLDDVVEFTGFLGTDDVARYLSTADVGIAPDPHSPLNDVSTMNKIVEYMAMGVPLVSFDLVEGRFSARDAALYAPPNDEHEFARLTAALLDDPDRRRQMGEYGQERVRRELSWEQSRAHLIAAYERLLASPRRGLPWPRGSARRRG